MKNGKLVLALLSTLLSGVNGVLAHEQLGTNVNQRNMLSIHQTMPLVYNKTKTLAGSEVTNTNNKPKKMDPKLKTLLGIIGGALGSACAVAGVKYLANRVLFCGPEKDDCGSSFDYLSTKCLCRFHKFKSDKLGVELYGHSLKFDESPIEKICIHFYGNAENSKKVLCDFECAKDGNNNKIIEKYKNTLFISFDYPLERYLETYFYGSNYDYSKDILSWNMMNEQELRIFAEDVLNYVINKYVKDKDTKPTITVSGFSLGGFPASCLANRNEVSSMYLRSPVCLPTFKFLKGAGKIATYPLFGYNLNSIENIINAKRTDPLKLVMSTGGERDICTLLDSIPYNVENFSNFVPEPIETQSEWENSLSNALKSKLPTNVNLKDLKVDLESSMNLAEDYIDLCLGN